MAKTNQIKKLVNGEIADADDVNQIAEDVGSEGGSIPYDPNTDQRDATGSQSLGSVAYPWGSLKVNKDAELVEVNIPSPTLNQSVTWDNLRKFQYLKDGPGLFAGQGGKFPKVNVAETALEYGSLTNIQIFTSSGTFVAPASITKVYVSMVGGGGGGGGGGNTAGSNAAGGGGSGGACILNYAFTVIPGNSYTVTIGAGGTGGANGAGTGTNGSTGGTTSFDSLSAVGGNGGIAGSATNGAGGSSVSNNGNAPATTGVGGSVYSDGSGAGGTGTAGVNGGGGGGTRFGVGASGTGTNATANTGAGGSGNYGPPTGNGGNGGSGVVFVMY